MRILLLMRGSAGCGKSTWIERNGLSDYALSADDIRMLCQSPQIQIDGTDAISQNNERIVWKMLFELLETRMKHGEFTVIDATNTKSVEMNRYKKLADTYKYRIYLVDFTDIPIEEVKRRNAQRETLKRVPESVIDRAYSRFATQKVPTGIKVIKPDELDKIWMHKIDLSNYKKIHHIGDIHGCYTALKEYFDTNGGIKDDEFYIFCGDYVDRGLENVEVLKFLISIKDRKNVLLLEGNHEKWLQIYSHGGRTASKEFELVTKPQLDKSDIDLKDIRQLYRKLGQCAYYQYDDKTVFVCHGGLSKMVEDFSLIATEQMISGVGSYNDYETVAESWVRNTPDNFYQIFGHRNTKSLPTRLNDRVFDLEGKVEFGGELRCVQLDHEHGFTTVEIKNTVFKTPEVLEQDTSKKESTIADDVIAMRHNKYIIEKELGNGISSFNFSEKAFYDKKWDEQTTKARGLFIDTNDNTIIARSYDKFFNINERPETKFDMLQYKLKFPVTAYVKENGYLLIVSYDKYNDDLFIASKSTTKSDFAMWGRQILHEKLDGKHWNWLKNYLNERSLSLCFECVLIEKDPHVMRYSESNIYLLEGIFNTREQKVLNYEELCNLSRNLGLPVKTKAAEFANWQEFYDFYFEAMDEDYEFDGRKIEGFVLEDADGFRVKMKLTYYNFWKFMRSIAQEVFRKGYTTRTGHLTTPTANAFYAWCKKQYETGKVDTLPRDICNLREMFYSDPETKIVGED